MNSKTNFTYVSILAKELVYLYNAKKCRNFIILCLYKHAHNKTILLQKEGKFKVKSNLTFLMFQKRNDCQGYICYR